MFYIQTNQHTFCDYHLLKMKHTLIYFRKKMKSKSENFYKSKTTENYYENWSGIEKREVESKRRKKNIKIKLNKIV